MREPDWKLRETDPRAWNRASNLFLSHCKNYTERARHMALRLFRLEPVEPCSEAEEKKYRDMLMRGKRNDG